jgi:L-amino acid N-acyltransferase YncA
MLRRVTAVTPELRSARIDDLPAIVAIYNSTIASRIVTAELTPVSVDSRRAWFAEHHEPERPLWVSVDPAGAVTGWVSLSNFNPRAAYHRTAEISVYVHEAARRQGLGRTLVQHAIDHAPRAGVDALVGLVFGHNQPSLALFEAFGFERWGHLPSIAELDGVRRDLVLVGKRL